MAEAGDQMDQSLDISGVVEEGDSVAEDERYQCEVCVYGTSDRSNFRRHVQGHEEKAVTNIMTSTPKTSKTRETFMCDKCGKKYGSRFGLQLHTKSKHDQTFKHTCPVCSTGFNQSVQYRFHIARHAELSEESCSFCKKGFRGAGSLKRHLVSCEENPDSTPGSKFKCDACGASFNTKAKLRYHMTGKHQPPKYQCNMCVRVYSWRSSLQKHKKCFHRMDSEA